MEETRTATLSNGRSVSLPLRCRCRVAGAAFPARWRRLREAVPAALTPLRSGPRTGAVALAGIDYRRAGEFDPYEEFAVIVPVARRAAVGGALPLGGVGGYVHALPVTTAASRRMGREIWGYPKTVAEIDVSDRGGDYRVAVAERGRGEGPGGGDGDGDLEPSLSLSVAGGRTRRLAGRLDSYAVKGGRPLRAPVEFDGRIGVGIGPGRAGLRLGSGPLAETLRSLGARPPALVRWFSPDLRAAVRPGERPDPSRRRGRDLDAGRAGDERYQPPLSGRSDTDTP